MSQENGSTPPSQPIPQHPFQFSLRTLLLTSIGMALLGGLAVIVVRVITRPPPLTAFDQQLRRAIANADRLEVRYGFLGFQDKATAAKTLFTVTDPLEIAEFHTSLVFGQNQVDEDGGCSCMGLLGFDWYDQDELLVSTALMHGTSIRCYDRGASGRLWCIDAELTKKSAAWLVDWFGKHGISAQTVNNPPFPQRAANHDTSDAG